MDNNNNRITRHNGRVPALLVMIVLMTAVSSMLCSAQDKTLDPNMKVYLDPIYYQAHHPDCISNGPLKQYEKTMTLAEADKAGVWLEASPGQYDNCKTPIISIKLCKH